MLASTCNADHQPFRLTSDPEFIYISPAQLDTYSRLFSAIHKQQKWLLLTGDSGTGKTLFLRRLQLDLENAGIAVCAFWSSVSSANQLWASCCERLELDLDPSEDIDALPALVDRLQRSAVSMVLLLDEADEIAMSVLESMARLVDACHSDQATVSIVLCGQPALEVRLQDLGLTESIATSVSLEPLPKHEIAHFIRHHLRNQAGHVDYQFSDAALERISDHCDGLPALINSLCSAALLVAQLEEQAVVSAEMIDDLVSGQWTETGSRAANHRAPSVAEAESVTTDEGPATPVDDPEDLPTLFPAARTVQPLEDLRAPHIPLHATQRRDRNATWFAETAADIAPYSLSNLHSLGDIETLELDGAHDEQISEEGLIRALGEQAHPRHPRTAQMSGEGSPTPRGRPPRRQPLSTPLAYLALVALLAVPVGTVLVSNERVTQAITWIQTAGSDIAEVLNQIRQKGFPADATIAPDPAKQSR